MINRVTLDYMVALLTVQPATCKLVGITIGQNEATASGALVRLKRLGLATRFKRDPLRNAPLSEKEKLGFVVGVLPAGKRPYLYELTPAAMTAAALLADAFTILDTQRPSLKELENERQTQNG
ncbi:MAG: hypothetical protein KAI80_08195 [Hyphomicrobiaceae bacterium]|nr:hypothetical protein [Hyphomicrobiaceae bacterium]